MRKSRYSQELVQTICDAIATTGQHQTGFKAGGIGKVTFYNWMREYPEFKERVDAAVLKFKDICPERLRNEALNQYADLLKNGQTVRWTKRVKRGEKKRYRVDENGNEVLVQVERYEDDIHYFEEQQPTPKWALEKILPPPDLESALKVLSQYGLTAVIDSPDFLKNMLENYIEHGIDLTEIIPSNANNSKHKPPGLSEEAVHEIRAKILGIYDEENQSLN